MALPLLELNSTLFECPEVDNRAPIRATPHSFIASGITSTTVTSSALSGGADTNYVGCELEAMDGNQKGQRRIILAFDNATDTATVDAWKGSADATVFRMWVLPQPWIVSSSAGAAGSPGPPTIIAITADDTSGRPGRDASENWAGTGQPNRYPVYCRYGNNVGRWALISGWSGGTFTLETYGAWVADAAGDLYQIGKMIEQTGGEFALGELTTAHIERPTVRGHCEQRAGVNAGRTCAINFNTEIHGPTGLSSGATQATRPTESGDMLDSMFEENRDAATAVGAGSTTTSVKVTTATGIESDGRFRMGSLALVGTEVACIHAMTDGGAGVDTWTVAPALTYAPVSGTAVYGGCCYTPLYPEEGHRTHSLWLLEGGDVWHYLYGCLPNLSIEGVMEAEIPRFVWSWEGDGYHSIDGYDWSSFLYSSGRFPIGTRRIPPTGRSATVKLNGSVIDCKGFTLNYGFEKQKKTVTTGHDQTGGLYVSTRKTTGTMTVWMEDTTYMEQMHRAASSTLMIQCGEVQGETIAIWMPHVQWTATPRSKDANGIVHEIAFAVRESNVTGDDGSGNTITVPDITLGVF